jgi:hypothetical protein
MTGEPLRNMEVSRERSAFAWAKALPTAAGGGTGFRVLYLLAPSRLDHSQRLAYTMRFTGSLRRTL